MLAKAIVEKLWLKGHITEEQKRKIEDTRKAFTNVTAFILENMKESREKSLTLTKLEEACMWAIKGITREEK